MKRILYIFQVLLIVFVALTDLSAQEICDNGRDDDSDGLVDSFDPDCPCDSLLYQAQCQIDCESISQNDISIKLKWQSNKIGNSVYGENILVGDIDSDDDVEIITILEGMTNLHPDSLIIFDGRDGTVERKFEIGIANFDNLTMGDINNDGYVEFFIPFSLKNDTIAIKSFSYTGDPLWQSDFIYGYFTHCNLADFNSDGVPEVYINNVILNSQTGSLLVVGDFPIGSVVYEYATSIAADLLPNDGLELVIGYMLFEVNIINPDDSVGNHLTEINLNNFANSPVGYRDGNASVADMDGDGLLDIVYTESNNPSSGLYIWNPRSRNIMAFYHGQEIGYQTPVLTDIDGDCSPEILIGFYNYKYDGTEELKSINNIGFYSYSRMSGSTVFDFNNDGKKEIIGRNGLFGQGDFVIYDCQSNDSITTYPIDIESSSGKHIIADIDNDGEAEIILRGGTFDSSFIYVLESDGDPWAPARSVWNQPGYHVTNVNDDLTIPIEEQNHAMFVDGSEDCLIPACSQPYNSFGVQATYRTQQGCVQWAAIDLHPALIDWTCSPDSITIRYIIHNYSDSKNIQDTFGLQLYDGNPLNQSVNSLYQEQIYLSIYKESISDTFYITIPKTNVSDYYHIVINDGGQSTTPLMFPLSDQDECDFDNNLDSIFIDIPPMTLNLGDEILRCHNAGVTIVAPTGFESYTWDDGSMDMSLPVVDDGFYYLTVTDICGQLYADTVEVITDPETIMHIGGTINEVCEGDSLAYEAIGDFDTYQWTSSSLVDCSTCRTVMTSGEESYWLYVIGRKDGCKSEDSIYITIIPPVEVDISKSICIGDSSQVGSFWFDSTDVYEVVLESTESGCDSIVTLDLTVDLAIFREDTLLLCDGDSIYILEQWIDNAGDYNKLYTTLGGCDSTQYYHVITDNKIWIYDTLQICDGDSIQIHGNWENQPNDYMITTNNGLCGTSEIITLEVNQSIIKSESKVLCPEDSINVNGDWIFEAGIYDYTLSGLTGCDTSFTLIVSQPVVPDEPIYDIDCEELKITTSINVIGDWEITWSNGAIVESTSYAEGGLIYVELSYEPECYEYYELSLPELPNISDIPDIQDMVFVSDTTFGLSLELDESEWQVNWSPDNIVDCNNCMDVIISPTQNTDVSIELIHSSGCVFTHSFKILIEEKEQVFDIPNVFSPNGDNDNDYWIVSLPDHIDNILEGAIYDRWGNRIIYWENTNEIVWDGSYRGEMVNPGVFVYYLKYKENGTKNNSIVIQKGDLTIIR